MINIKTARTVSLLAAMIFFSCTTLGINNIPINEFKKRYADGDSRYVTIDGITVHYKDQGRGPTLLLMHGVCASLHTWDGWVDALKNSYRIVRMDFPGFGVTGPADRKFYNPDSAILFIDKFVQALNLNDFSMAGNSLGGYFSWKYALRHPDRVKRLILIDPVGYSQDLPWLLSLASNPVVRPLGRLMMPRFMFNRAVEQVYGDGSRITDAVRLRYFEMAMRDGNKGSYIDVFTVMRTMARDPLISQGVPALRMPVMVMWGKKDAWIPILYMGNWRRDLPGARFIVYDDAGHTPMEEIPERTARDAMDFLSAPGVDFRAAGLAR